MAEAMADSAAAVERRRHGFGDLPHGGVRVSLAEGNAAFLARHLAALHEQLPEIELELVVSPLLADLTRREAELGIRDCRPIEHNLLTRRLGMMAHAVYGSRYYVAAHSASLTDARWRDCTWIAFPADHASITGQWLEQRLNGRQPGLRINNVLARLDAVRHGAGLSVLPCALADAAPDLIRVTEPEEATAVPKWLLVHRDVAPAPAVRAVIEALVALFRREQPALLGRLSPASSLAAE
jgi:DNA-binding transcriptional LysR family regulator